VVHDAVEAQHALVLVAGRYGSGADGMVVSADFSEQVRREAMTAPAHATASRDR